MKRSVFRQSKSKNTQYTRILSPIRLIFAIILVCMVTGLTAGSVAPANNTSQSASPPHDQSTWLDARLTIDSPSLVERFSAYTGGASHSSGNTSDTEAFEGAMRTAFEGAVPDFSGAATQLTAYDIRTFTLITDNDLADPSHCGREQGVKVTILYDNSGIPDEDSLWGHETDATTVARALYTSDAGDRIGTLSIVFKYDGQEDYRLKLTLDAADAERFAGSWQDGTFIRRADWSGVDINADDIAPYEHPDRILEPNDTVMAHEGYTPQIVATKQEAFQKELYSSTVLLTSTAAGIAGSAEAEQFDKATALAEDLIDTSDAARAHLESLDIDPDLEPARQEYLRGVDEYRKSGSYIWNGSQHTNAEDFEAADAHLKAGEAHINTAFDMLGMEPLDSRSYTRPPCDPYPGALSLGEHFIYRDDQGVNDISVIVDSYETKTGYMIEENGTCRRVNAEYGNKFLYVVCHATHLGFRGNGTEQITTPPTDAFTLILDGEEYAHSTPERYVKELGQPYSATTIERKEVHEGFLLFAVPETTDPSTGYVRLDLGGDGQPVWKLKPTRM